MLSILMYNSKGFVFLKRKVEASLTYLTDLVNFFTLVPDSSVNFRASKSGMVSKYWLDYAEYFDVYF